MASLAFTLRNPRHQEDNIYQVEVLFRVKIEDSLELTTLGSGEALTLSTVKEGASCGT